MPEVSRLGDNYSAHGCWPVHAAVAASGNVFVNGIAVHRQGDANAAHTCPDIPETHSGACASGSSTVFINGLQCARIGDPSMCGGNLIEGSGNVFAGG